MRFFVIACTIAAVLAGCSSREDRVAFDGIYFKTKISKVEGQRDVFTLLVKNASQSIDGAREAARYEATVYCVNNYGSSDIVWVVGPDTSADNLRLVDDSLTFSGSCPS
ncbi:hypothetical protein [Sulfitobacter sp. CW3]|uniref:hypothetical protein n=1 Tax=Sulfitobacter sp. CW3 TaxID=2861965 RepID=UPI001C5F6DB3|nr:hypothetical protein [Sulfitobacter sp. CW3]MBW4960556.1 hypothetical protein [Sulfitobacter sp. CW3]|tara:strand:- start:1165 stop:1491 length:327 start_codon:yes stop_codon:yes gene_type:complete